MIDGKSGGSSGGIDDDIIARIEELEYSIGMINECIEFMALDEVVEAALDTAIEIIQAEIDKLNRPGKPSASVTITMLTADKKKTNLTLSSTPKEEAKSFLSPSTLVAYADKYVIGQDLLKRTLAVYLASHYNYYVKTPIDEPSRPALLITGPSGSGKTYTVQQMAKALDKVFIVVDMTTITPSGYVGDSFTGIWEKVKEEAKSSGKSAKDPIILLDELDKLQHSGEEGEFYRKIQGSLLKILEQKYSKEIGGRPCFVIAGAFADVRKDKQSKLDAKSIGFGVKADKGESYKLTHKDIIESGMLPELIGRIGNIVETDPISDDMLRDLITKPVGCIKEYYDDLFKHQCIEDKVTDTDVDKIIELVKSQGIELGARALRSVAERYFLDRLFF